MKKYKILCLLLCWMSFLPLLAQEKTRKELRIEKKVAKQQEIKALVDSKQFEFVARNSSSHTFQMVDLTIISNYIRFKPDFIKSEMPFFGRGFSGLAYGGSDAGLKFEGVPEKFEVKKDKKQYVISVTVRSEQDSFDLTLAVSFEGSSRLTITSNKRESISYIGEIKAIKELEKDSQ